eukprot:1420002-Lingulodinium_polyedra.AAC.1
MRKEFASLKSVVEEVRRAGSVCPGSSSAPTAAPRGPPGAASPHEARYLEVKGFVEKWEMRSEQGLTEEEAAAWLGKLE